MTENTKGAPRPTTGGQKTLQHAMSIIRQEAWKQQALAERAIAQKETDTRWQLRQAAMQEGGAL